MSLYGEYSGPADEVDLQIVSERSSRRRGLHDIQEGDFIEFADGEVQRVSALWHEFVQCSESGSWHLNESGTCQFSGSLHPGVARSTLTDTGRWQPAPMWISHHGLVSAHRRVEVSCPVRVWHCTGRAPR